MRGKRDFENGLYEDYNDQVLGVLYPRSDESRSCLICFFLGGIEFVVRVGQKRGQSAGSWLCWDAGIIGNEILWKHLDSVRLHFFVELGGFSYIM